MIFNFNLDNKYIYFLLATLTRSKNFYEKKNNFYIS